MTTLPFPDTPYLLTGMDRLHRHLERLPIKLLVMDEQEVAAQPATNKWSKKEILGHLLDSAQNNHHRFYQLAMAEGPLQITSYDQNNWVKVHRYNEASWAVLVEDWKALNCRLLRLWVKMDEGLFSKPIILPSGEHKTGEFLVNDYTDHQEHHLRQILGKL